MEKLYFSGEAGFGGVIYGTAEAMPFQETEYSHTL
jgi:hypothetical protein